MEPVNFLYSLLSSRTEMGLEWLEERPARPLWEYNFWGTFIKEAEINALLNLLEY